MPCLIFLRSSAAFARASDSVTWAVSYTHLDVYKRQTPYRRRPPAAGPGYVGVITQTEARGLARNAAAGLSLMVDELAALKGKPRPPRAKPAREPEAVGAGAPVSYTHLDVYKRQRRRSHHRPGGAAQFKL